MTNETLPPVNPAFLLHNILSEWKICPDDKEPIEARWEWYKSTGDKRCNNYWYLQGKVIDLLNEIEEYTNERAAYYGRENKNLHLIASLNTGILYPKKAERITLGTFGTSEKALSMPARMFSESDLDDLENLGMQWSSPSTEVHVEAIGKLREIAGAVHDFIEKCDDLDDEYKNYFIALTNSLEAAAREVSLHGEMEVARLAAELQGALDSFLPKNIEESEEVKGFKHRIPQWLPQLFIGFGREALRKAIENPEKTVRAIEAGIKVADNAFK